MTTILASILISKFGLKAMIGFASQNTYDANFKKS
ncbi:hypothetical protein COLO4_21783 [Corchorus olitorius]|uniref:Uncharacterized protein n=1 Tax=Corchorus olitorius TaxID=93759 RepID=A0A1R3IR00_9ROSI|nr:hypothetical protein COLO4_21783 [Corchorus olitorius]